MPATPRRPPTCCASSDPSRPTRLASAGSTPAWLVELEGVRRAIRVRLAGDERWAAIEDAGRLRDALGAALPVGHPRGVPRAGRRPGGRPGRPATPARTGRSPRARSPSGSGSAPQSCSARCTGSPRPVASWRASCAPAAAAASGATRRSFGCSAAGRSRRCGRRPSRCPPSPWLGSCRHGRTSGARCAASTASSAVVEQLQGAPLPASALETPRAARPGARLLSPHCSTS